MSNINLKVSLGCIFSCIFWSGTEVEQLCTKKHPKSRTTYLHICNTNIKTSKFSTPAQTKVIVSKRLERLGTHSYNLYRDVCITWDILSVGTSWLLFLHVRCLYMLCPELHYPKSLQCERQEKYKCCKSLFDLLADNDWCLCDTQVTLIGSVRYFRTAFQNTFPVLVIYVVWKNG